MNIAKGFSKRKVKIFLVFLLCSSLAWLLSNLSEPYTSNTTFNLGFEEVPDSLLLTNVSKNRIRVKLKASGYQFLSFGFKRKNVSINLSSIQKIGSTYFVPQRVYKAQIERQLSNSIALLDLDNDTIFVDFFKVYSKEVPVISVIDLVLAPNHLLEGELLINPSTVIVKGPKSEIDSITGVRTTEMVLTELTSDFSHDIALIKPAEIVNTEFSIKSVNISGTVSKFSEKIIKVPVEVINLPDGLIMQTFPNTVSILCKAKLEELRVLGASDFLLSVDYHAIKEGSTNILPLQLLKKPEKVHSAVPMETQVEYILRKE
ncbi:MAG: hypothetical protein COA50_12915 [Flavobacteriaceae bacterium]|nr:MAG: hypothetical protein COA50_12915 [Flavobacteriaceae bacterium]